MRPVSTRSTLHEKRVSSAAASTPVALTSASLGGPAASSQRKLASSDTPAPCCEGSDSGRSGASGRSASGTTPPSGITKLPVTGSTARPPRPASGGAVSSVSLGSGAGRMLALGLVPASGASPPCEGVAVHPSAASESAPTGSTRAPRRASPAGLVTRPRTSGRPRPGGRAGAGWARTACRGTRPPTRGRRAAARCSCPARCRTTRPPRRAARARAPRRA